MAWHAAAAGASAAGSGGGRKALALVAVVLVALVGVPLMFVFAGVVFFAQTEKQLAESGCLTSVASPNARADEIPAELLRTYMEAGQEYSVDWRILAALGKVETDHGRNLAVSSAGALGWMQFMPSTWAAYGVDANDDGEADPWQMRDAVYGAANYMNALLEQEDGDLRGAIFGYNHADWYVEKVVAQAKAYGYGSRAQPTTPQAALGVYDTDQAATVAQRRTGRVAFAVADADGRILAAYKPNQQFRSASITKAMLLVAALRAHGGGEVPAGLRAQLDPMIRVSDNEAANAVFAQLGSAAVRQVAADARMRSFELDTRNPRYVLGHSLVTAGDQARLWAQIDQLVPPRHRDYARSLLSSVTARWGIVTAAGIDAVVLSKAGWRPEPADDDGWTVVQGAQIPGASGPLGIAVLTDANPTEAYGQETVRVVSAALLTGAGIDTLATGCEGISAGGAQSVRAAADELEAMGLPYCYGGGHGTTPAKPSGGQWCIDNATGARVYNSGMRGLDCSSSVSWVLQRAGYDVPTMATPAWHTWAEPGRGEDGITLWNKPYGSDAHIIIQIGDRFFGTSSWGHPSKGHGPAWFDEPPSAGYLAGFNPMHIPEHAKPKIMRDVAVVGDSLAEGTARKLPALLDGITVTTDARVSRPLAEGMSVVRALDRKPGVLALSLFTNDDPRDVAALSDAVRESTRHVAQGGCVVWATIARPPVGGVSYQRANELLRSIGADNPQVIVVDWAAAVNQHPGWLRTDGVHATDEGYDARARLYAEGVRRCLA